MQRTPAGQQQAVMKLCIKHSTATAEDMHHAVYGDYAAGVRPEDKYPTVAV
jgi:hypothetical protein